MMHIVHASERCYDKEQFDGVGEARTNGNLRLDEWVGREKSRPLMPVRFRTAFLACQNVPWESTECPFASCVRFLVLAVLRLALIKGKRSRAKSSRTERKHSWDQKFGERKDFKSVDYY